MDAGGYLLVVALFIIISCIVYPLGTIIMDSIILANKSDFELYNFFANNDYFTYVSLELSFMVLIVGFLLFNFCFEWNGSNWEKYMIFVGVLVSLLAPCEFAFSIVLYCRGNPLNINVDFPYELDYGSYEGMLIQRHFPDTRKVKALSLEATEYFNSTSQRYVSSRYNIFFFGIVGEIVFGLMPFIVFCIYACNK
jgi:hypothetical protein